MLKKVAPTPLDVEKKSDVEKKVGHPLDVEKKSDPPPLDVYFSI